MDGTVRQGENVNRASKGWREWKLSFELQYWQHGFHENGERKLSSCFFFSCFCSFFFLLPLVPSPPFPLLILFSFPFCRFELLSFFPFPSCCFDLWSFFSFPFFAFSFHFNFFLFLLFLFPFFVYSFSVSNYSFLTPRFCFPFLSYRFVSFPFPCFVLRILLPLLSFFCFSPFLIEKATAIIPILLSLSALDVTQTEGEVPMSHARWLGNADGGP